MSSWEELRGELDRWADDGRVATFWWRDDDAVRPTRSLHRLLELRSVLDVPLSIAVIPALLEPGLARELETVDEIHVMQHGYAHRNHASAEQKKAEFGPDRDLRAMGKEIARGWHDLQAAFPRSVVPVLVPPWNRIDARLVPELPALGLRGLSTFTARRGVGVPRVRETNCHVDPIDWHAGRGFKGAQASLAQAVRHLRRRRERTVDEAEPTGLLSHHLDHDDPGWDFLAQFIQVTCAHRAARWLDGFAAVFGP